MKFNERVESAKQQAIAALQQEHSPSDATVRTEVDLRYLGTESTLTLDAQPWHTLAQRFHELHAQTFGFVQSGKRIELAVVRCEATYASHESLDHETLACGWDDGDKTHLRATLFYAGAWHTAPLYQRENGRCGSNDYRAGDCV